MASNIFARRIKGEMKNLQRDPLPFADAYPTADDNKIWYFILKGGEDTPYEGGYYLGQVLLPANYPSKAPDFKFLTPNGRFDINCKICLTNSAYHPESHTPAWNIKTILIGMISIISDDTTSGIGHLRMDEATRKQMRDNSFNYNAKNYPEIFFNEAFRRFVVVPENADKFSAFVSGLEDSEKSETIKSVIEDFEHVKNGVSTGPVSKSTPEKKDDAKVVIKRKRRKPKT
jgi:ubiquitin-protein ligase